MSGNLPPPPPGVITRTLYVVSTSGTPTATARPTMSITTTALNIAVSTGSCTFTGIPPAASVQIDAGTTQPLTPVPDGTLTLSLSNAGTYIGYFTGFPYIDESFTVVAS